MRNYFAFVSILYSFIVFGQSGNNPTINKNLPTLIPPSPTVAALMKFEETNVNNYTGSPDVSIPLYSTATLSKDINLNIALKYNSSSSAVDERASDVGLGWSLFAGGTISRTVRNIPDEYYETQGILAHGSGKIGIYQTNAYYKNKYNDIVRIYNEGSLQTNDTINEYLWNVTERNLYDTEYDSWQFNFMGKSGHFIIKKNLTTNQLEVSNLDLSSNLKIVNIYNTNDYSPTSFEIYDDLGYKYVFDVPEITKANTITTTQGQSSENPEPVTTTSKFTTFKSAFHLSKIYDNNNNLLLNIGYNNDGSQKNMENTQDYTNVYNLDSRFDLQDIFEYITTHFGGGSERVESKNISTTNQKWVTTKKITNIDVVNKCHIDFNYLKGREDTNFYHSDSSYVFKGIVIKDWNYNNIKKVSLTHDYSTVIKMRLILQSVSFENYKDSKKESYFLEYRKNPGFTGTIGKDYWGYYNLRPSYDVDGTTYREVTPETTSLETIQKMTLPTGGCIIFDFEPNTYSYIGDNPVTDFNDNIRNWDYQSSTVVFDSAFNTKQYVFTIGENQKQDITFVAQINTYGASVSDYRFKLYRYDGTSYTFVRSFEYGNCQDPLSCNQKFKDLDPGVYYMDFSSMDGSFPENHYNASITAYYKEKNGNNLQFLYGGGNRIRRIGYFTSDTVSKDYYSYSSPTLLPDKEKKYSYNRFINPERSSGSLVCAKPVFEYNFNRQYYFYLLGMAFTCPIEKGVIDFYFTKYTDYNNIKAIKTAGADIGYQNVTVSELNNGETRYTYKSPIDVPESDALNDSYPFLPYYNLDYQRGLIKKEEVLDKNLKTLKEVTYDYQIDEVSLEDTLYGLTTNYLDLNDPFNYLFDNYDMFKSAYNFLNTCTANCTLNIGCEYKSYIKLPREYIDINLVHEARGWSKLTGKTTQEYFYEPGNSIPNIVQTDETYSYNTINKQISESTVTNSKGQVLKTDYFYHTGDAPEHQNRISDIERIEQYKGSTLLSKSQIVYDNSYSGNAAYLPKFILTSKGSNTAESRVYYSAYDSYGHPTELQQSNGTFISYIWGYNKSQPIAKVENATNAEIATATGINFDEIKEGDLTAINNLRVTLPNALTTSYTYIPLVGVETITDPKGYITTYEYDGFGRLARVRDADGKILSENQYNYRTQN